MNACRRSASSTARRRRWVAVPLLLWAGACAAADLAPLAGEAALPPAPWHFAGLPLRDKPKTRFEVVELEGTRVLRIESDRAFGNLVHPLAAGTRATGLAWRARVDQPVVGANLQQRSGEDTALRVCASFALPMARVPFFERQFLRLAQAHSDEHLPTALLCYVTDAALPAGSLVVSPFTRRMRSIVVAHAPLGRWAEERHPLGADFLRAFGEESTDVPPLVAIVVGADGDNTASHSVAYLDALHLTP